MSIMKRKRNIEKYYCYIHEREKYRKSERKRERVRERERERKRNSTEKEICEKNERVVVLPKLSRLFA